MFGLTRTQIAHAIMALGTGLGVFLGEAATISANPWTDAGCYAGIATLAALGVGVAKRAASSTT
jgi:hypothetical protein